MENRLKIGTRLLSVAKMVGKTEKMADIGSDHALLPIWLLGQGSVKKAIAGEFGDGPFSRARQAAYDSGRAAQLEVRQGNGLQILQPNEVETVVIAGMGGDLIVEILQDSPDKTNSFSRYILQPMRHEAVLRKWLSEQRWPIVREELIFENQKYYVVLETHPGNTAPPLKDLEILLGPRLLVSKDPKVFQWLEQMQNKYAQIAQKIALSRTATQEEKSMWKRRVQQLEKILKDFYI